MCERLSDFFVLPHSISAQMQACLPPSPKAAISNPSMVNHSTILQTKIPLKYSFHPNLKSSWPLFTPLPLNFISSAAIHGLVIHSHRQREVKFLGLPPIPPPPYPLPCVSMLNLKNPLNALRCCHLLHS